MLNLKKESNIRRDKILLSITAIFLSLYSAFSLTAFACASQGVQQSVVRLHILANSDSEKDQHVKLKVRDALLSKNTALLSEGVCRENAYDYFCFSKDMLLQAAESVLRENGFSYNAEISLEEEYYETRQYGSLTFPAGKYLSLKVVLGEGKGHNWWCVMFPPMCVPVADDVDGDSAQAEKYLTQAGNELVNSGNKYIMKFKILELYEELRERLGL